MITELEQLRSANALLRRQNASLQTRLSTLQNDVDFQLQAMKEIAAIVRLPTDKTMASLPAWIREHFSP